VQIGYFTERPYRYVPEEEAYRNQGFFGISNSFFDPKKGAQDYNYYLDENCYAEDLGFDAVALNEHHGTPFCMGGVMNVEAAILARITSKVRIVLVGNPLPVIKNPLRMAEELAEIDMISRGRLVAGWVRGAGSEQFFNHANPAYNRELFEEAHDFVIQAWTRPGPWRYEGKHFNYLYVNPWALPLQKPTPPMWIPGVLSYETVKWCAEHRYPYIGLGTALGPSCDLWDYYADEAAKVGYEAGSENFGYIIPAFLAETEERAQELGRGFAFGAGQTAFSRPEHTLPPGYNTKDAISRLARQPGGSWLGISADKLRKQREGVDEVDTFQEARRKALAQYEASQKAYRLVIGTPKSVLPKMKAMLQVLRPGVLVVFNVQGPVSNQDRQTSMRLFAQEVMPQLREYAKELGLVDPIERTPGSVPLRSGVSRRPVVDRSPLATLGLQ